MSRAEVVAEAIAQARRAGCQQGIEAAANEFDGACRHDLDCNEVARIIRALDPDAVLGPSSPSAAGGLKTLLFVQRGEGRPKCQHRLAPGQPWTSMRNALATPGYTTGGYLAWEWSVKAAQSADRWWLVECENAEAGRTLIAEEGNDLPFYSVDGRILASGGQSDD